MADQPEAGVSVEDRIMGMLDAEENPEEVSQEEPEAEESEDTEQPESEEEESEEQPEDSEEQEEELFFITHNGEQKPLTPEEVKEMAQKGYDYTQKTQEVSDQRRQLEAKEAEIKQRSEELERYQSDIGLIAALDHQIQAYQSLNWPDLADQDIAEFTRRKEELRDLKDARAEAEKSLTEKREKDSRETQSAYSKRMNEMNSTLQRQVKDWGPDLQAKLRDTAKTYGASDESIAGIEQPWIVLALNDAMKYRNLKASKPQIDKRVSNKPKVIKPGAKPVNQDKSSEYRQAAKKLTGRKQDEMMAKALENML